ncbi:hypothetical protein [Sinorhizobium meliloti]|uniref:Uncharacterized protein n=1 Tax=Rhizobium meliloti TaxID=382 RepID=A0AAW9U0G8_RHIML|nr:hypothetical protein [Sinorhizobium meliloti]MQW38181.1 hypothetical protein [Sinorhizobium meliloti]
MPTISEVRQKFPQYHDLSDDQLADALHRKFYSDIPREEFNAKIGYDAKPRPSGRHLSFEEGAEMLDREERMAGRSGTFGAATTSYLNSMPIVGPMLLGTAQRGAAALSSAFNGESYDDNLKEAQAITDAAQAAHPYVSAGAGVTGAVAGTLPMVVAAPAAFGGGSAGLLARSGMSMLGGGVVGGTDAAVRSGGDLDEVKLGAGWGAGLGLFGPAVGKAVGAGARKVADAYRTAQAAKAAGTRAGTINQLAKAIAGDGLDEAAVRARLDTLGPESMIADLGPNTQGKAAALAAMPGRGQEVMRSALEARHGGANARLAATVDETLGRNVVPSEIERGIEANQQLLSPVYRDAFSQARPYDVTAITHDLDRSIQTLRGDAQRALQRVRGMLNVNGQDVVSNDPRVVFQTRQAIDGVLATEANPKVISALTETRQMLDDALTRAVPRIKEADAAYAELARQREALQRGQSVLDHGRTAPRPSELAAEVQKGALPQGMQIGPSAVPLRLSQGARAEVDRILGSNANDIARLNKLVKSDGDWNRARLSQLFGKDKADRLFQVLDNELQFAKTRDVVTRNSETARRQQHIADLGGSEDPNFARNAYAAGGTSGAVRAAGVRLVDKLANSIMGGRREAANVSLANAMVSNRTALVDAIAQAQRTGQNPALVEALAKSLLLGSGTSGAR